MKLRPIFFYLLATFFALGTAHAQNAETEFKALVEKMKVKIQAGQRTPEALAAEVAELDAIIAKYKGKKSEEVAQVAYAKAVLYSGVFGDKVKGLKLAEEVQKDFPGTKAAGMVEALKKELQSAANKEGVVGKPAPEINFEWSSEGDFKQLSSLKGKVVVLDFWATWCGPCISSFPQIRELTEHYKGKDVVVLGVTSIQGQVSNLEAEPINVRGDPMRERMLMKDFMTAKSVTWPVVFSKEKVFNPDYGVTGIPHMAIIAPDGKVRHNGLHPAMPHAEKVKLIDAILAEFKTAKVKF